MPITPAQFQVLYPQIAAWIQETLRSHADSARSVQSAGFPTLSQYYSAGLLQGAKYIPVANPPKPPLARLGLTQFHAFEQQEVKGVTYLDTYFVRLGCEDQESLHFHELIHVVQWSVLGPEQFVAAYADGLERFGYWHCPLEVMAYKAESEFVRGIIFDAEKRVRKELAHIYGL